MCGIIGIMCKPGYRPEEIHAAIDVMEHRGPDDQGVMYIERSGPLHTSATEVESHGIINAIGDSLKLVVGQVRFSLVDLSTAGHQPFVTDDGRICLVFNGEIYNYVELRRELEAAGITFSTQTDTEVLAKAYIHWGVECFNKFIGFWAVAIYDLEEKTTLLARDRLGKAPLYFIDNKQGFFFSSEINSLLELAPEERSQINEESILHFANWLKKDFNNTTFYKNIETFPAASYAWLSDDGSLDIHQYWDIPNERMSESEISIDDAVEQFQFLISEATRVRIRADAPVAVQLSGGMDSSTLLASAVDHASSVDAYTVKYGYGEQDEEPYARMVADRYKDKVNYHVVNPVEQDLLKELPDYTSLMSEPYHSPNQLSSQHIWKRMANSGIRAVIYGGGGDEVFAGYGSEYYAPYLRQLLSQGNISRFSKEFFGSSEYRGKFPVVDCLKMAARMFPVVPRKSTHGRVRFIDQRINPLNDDLINSSVRTPPNNLFEKLEENMKDWRMNYWLRIDNQNSMGVPVELRSPFLDHRVIEFAFKLPVSYLMRDGWLKWIVRQSMVGKLPAEIVWRKVKMGFPFPLREWLGKNASSFRGMLEHSSCPSVDAKKLFKNFDQLNQVDSEYLWGMISILMWWEYCVQKGRA